MSFLTHAYLLQTYGPRLDLTALAKVLGFAEGTVRNKLARGELGFVYKDGGSLFADAADVADYLDSRRPKQEQPA